MDPRFANILFKDQPAGLLSETASGGTRFTYLEGWNEPIACAFPIVRREHEWVQGLHPFFQHLAPEGWLREEQARTAHIAQEDDLGLLIRYGADCIGAVGVAGAEGAGDGAEITEATASPGRTVSGIQKKLLVVANPEGKGFRPAGPVGLAPYIAKFNSDRIDSLVRNEALSLRWATALLGADEVNRFTLAHIATLDETALVVTRFDRSAEGEKLRLEDFAQILNKPRGADYAGKYDSSYEEAAGVIRAFSGRPEIDLARYLRRLVAFVLVGNCDAHLKNFSLLETPTGLRLSPVYDVVNTAIYDGFDQSFALTLGGKRVALDQITRPLLETLGRDIGIPDRAIAQIFEEFRRTVPRVNTSILKPSAGEGPDGFVTRFAEIVSRACLRILE